MAICKSEVHMMSMRKNLFLLSIDVFMKGDLLAKIFDLLVRLLQLGWLQFLIADERIFYTVIKIGTIDVIPIEFL